jgi:hypothetical protein
MLKGSCLCGAVRYEISAPIHEIHHCHCSMCRKAHGAAFSTFGRIDKSAFRLTEGSGMVRAYQSSAAVERSFCSRCGANLLFSFGPLPAALWVTIGTLDDDPGVRPDGHIFVKSKASWFDITDQLERHDEYPPNPNG